MVKIDLEIKQQKDEECLPECLFSVFRYYNVDVSREDIISFVSTNSDKLYDWEFKAGNMALNYNLQSKIYTNVSYLFDPSWYNLNKEEIIGKLKKEADFFADNLEKISSEPKQKNFIFPNDLIARRYKKEVDAVIKYIESGGLIVFEPISVDLIKDYIDKKVPVIVSLNPTLLHHMQRAYNYAPDDIRGNVWGHVVSINGYDGENFIIADPGGDFYKGKFEYKIETNLVIESILRYNGQMIVIEKG